MSLKTLIKLPLYAAALYLFRFYGIGLIEQMSFFNAMHQPMIDQPDCFGFTMDDLPMSHLYNYGIWLVVVVLFHLIQPQISLPILAKSLLLFGLAALFFICITGAFMNHFNQGIRVFFRYVMLDALLVFGILGLVNGLLYPLIFMRSRSDQVA